MPIYPNIYQTLLPGPIVELRGYLAACGLRGRLYAYLNYNGPTGTARDASDAKGGIFCYERCHLLMLKMPSFA